MICGGTEAASRRWASADSPPCARFPRATTIRRRPAVRGTSDRDGFVIGEGAGILILEELEFAKQRGANILAELVGYGMSGDAYHITAARPKTAKAASASCAMRCATPKLSPTQIGLRQRPRHLHADRRPLETHAIETCLRRHAYKVPVSSTKSMTGHLLGGAGGLEAGITVLALRDQILPPTINLENPDPDTKEMDFVPNQARKASRIRHVQFLRVRRHQRRAGIQALVLAPTCPPASCSAISNNIFQPGNKNC